MSRLVDIDEVIRVAKNTFPEEDVRKIMWVLCYTPTAYDVSKVVEEIENINTTWNCQECIHLETCDKIQMEKGNGGEHLDLCAEVVKVLSTDIVRKGGVE